jgi:hypothetical protein
LSRALLAFATVLLAAAGGLAAGDGGAHENTAWTGGGDGYECRKD